MSLATIKPERKEIPLGLIDDPAHPSRSSMDDDKMAELVANIRENGLIQELVLARVGTRFEVVAGHRRFLASQRAGLAGAPASIYPTRSDALDAIQYAENRFREELSTADEAIWFSELLDQKCGGDVDVLCARLGEHRNYVEKRLLLFSGDSLVFEALKREQIVIGVAEQLNKCPVEWHRRGLLDAAIRGGATIAVVSGWIARECLATHPDVARANLSVVTSAPGPVMTTNYFTCKVCGGTDDVSSMRPVNVHAHCERAILDPLLRSYHGEG